MTVLDVECTRQGQERIGVDRASQIENSVHDPFRLAVERERPSPSARRECAGAAIPWCKPDCRSCLPLGKTCRDRQQIDRAPLGEFPSKP
jgi:hypothetical protein